MDSSPREPRKGRRLVLAGAAVMAVLVGGLMAGVAGYFGIDVSDVVLIGILGGLGAAAAVLVLISAK
jgi:phage shock protein PspC (stress-responsive transcriptional regulator)